MVAERGPKESWQTTKGQSVQYPGWDLATEKEH